MKQQHQRLLQAGVMCLVSLLALGVHAQVQDLTGLGAPPDLLGAPAGIPTNAQATPSVVPSAQASPAPQAAPVVTAEPAQAISGKAPMVADIDLGHAGGDGVNGQLPEPSLGVARRAAMAAEQSAEATATSMPAHREGVERAVFARMPVRVGLPIKRERLITLPSPAVLHVPDDIEAVARVEAIDRTIYVTALVPFAPIRIVAELIDGGQQIPLDLVAGPMTEAASPELEVFVGSPRASASAGSGSVPNAAVEPDAPAADMVELTRFAARMLYAPRRLAVGVPGISQVQVPKASVPGLVRGLLVETVPVGQWRSAGLYVTAVRITNQSKRAVEIPLENLRGKWLAVTAQHGRLGAAGTETDTSALYLICDRAFEACL